MRIYHHDMTFGGHVADTVQDQRGAGRFASARGAQQCEMFTQHGIDIKRRANIAGWKHGANLNIGARIGRVHLVHISR